MDAQDWTSYDETIDLWRKIARNLGAQAEANGSTDAMDWTSSDLLIDLQRKAVTNSYQATL